MPLAFLFWNGEEGSSRTVGVDLGSIHALAQENEACFGDCVSLLPKALALCIQWTNQAVAATGSMLVATAAGQVTPALSSHFIMLPDSEG